MALQKKAAASGFEVLNSEICFNIEVSNKCKWEFHLLTQNEHSRTNCSEVIA